MCYFNTALMKEKKKKKKKQDMVHMWVKEQPRICSTEIIIQKDVADEEQSASASAYRLTCILCLQHVHIFMSLRR